MINCKYLAERMFIVTGINVAREEQNDLEARIELSYCNRLGRGSIRIIHSPAFVPKRRSVCSKSSEISHVMNKSLRLRVLRRST